MRLSDKVDKIHIDELIAFADQHYDGHLTIMRFTGNWRIEFGTPFEMLTRDAIQAMPSGKTFVEAMMNAYRQHEAEQGGGAA